MSPGRRRRGGRERDGGETVPAAEFRSYHGRPILKEPAWRTPDVPAYLFLGGAAGVAAAAAGLADVTRRPDIVRTGRLVAAAGAMASVGFLVHDLGRPERFLYMLRVFKPTSPLSVGSWILAPFSGVAGLAAASELTGALPPAGRLAGATAALLGPAMTTYTAVLLADTAVPAWHEGYRELPFLFAGSALTSGAGALLAAGSRGPIATLGWVGAGLELAAGTRLERRGLAAEPYRIGRAGRLMRAGRTLALAGAGLTAAGTVLCRHRRVSRVLSVAGGAAYLAGGLCLRFGVFHAGVASARDPKYVVVAQRERLQAQAATTTAAEPSP